MRIQSWAGLIAIALFSSSTASAVGQVNITTWQTNLQHTGNNAQETILNPGVVASPGNFGLLFSQPLDGQTYGQPLLVSGLTINGATHNVVYAATEHCSIFAYDADTNIGTNSAYLWHVSLLPAGTVPVPQSVVGSSDIPLELGITTTPVIDTSSNTIYIVSKVQRTSDTTYHQYLYALDLTTGVTKFGSPVEVTPTFPGTASDSSGGVIPFSALHEHLRCAMILYNGVVYLTYASHSDTTPYHGEIVGYNATTLQLVQAFITTPNGGTSEGGIWQSGAGPAVDSLGNLFVAVGNGAWDQNNSSYGTDWGESMLKIPTNAPLAVSFANTLNWFTPNNYQALNNGDLDLGSGGLLLLPDQDGPHQHIMVGGGKGAVLYVVDRDNLGGLSTPDNAIQEIPEPNAKWLFVTPAYFNGYIYYSASGGQLEQRAVGYDAVDGSYISTTPIVSSDTFNNKGYGCFISSNGTTNGIVWILTGSGVKAYDATNVSAGTIYAASATLPGNISCSTTKFSLPIVANGKLYYTAYNNTNVGHLLVYGLLPAAVGTPAAPSDAVAVATSATGINVSWTSNSTNESGFKIKRSTTATGTYTQIGTTGAGVTSYTDSGLTPSTVYYYQVVATNANGDSNNSNVAVATTFPHYAENGLVAYWNLDETSGTTVNDATANAQTGTINGEADLEAGFINNGVNFHGTGQATSSITVPNKSDLQFTATQSFTLAAWIYLSALRNSEETVIAKSRDQGNYYGIWIDASNRWIFRGPAGDLIGPTATGSAWTHVAVVQDGTANTRTIYVNGVAAGSGAAQAGDGAGALWIGQQNITGNFESFPGTVDEVRLYNRALAASEITNLLGPPILQASSVQAQGLAGNQGLLLSPGVTNQVEPRMGATIGQYNLVLSFSAPVSAVTATLKRQDGALPVGAVSSVSYDSTGRIVTVTLSGVGNAESLIVQLSGIAPGNGTADIPFNVLWGDVNADNVVNSLDVSIVQNTHTNLLNASTAAYDINCDGAINSSDDSLVTTALGTALGPQVDTNLAIFQPPTALSYNANNTPNLAFDLNLTTRWESQQMTDPEWVYVNLGSICTIHTVILNWENAAGQNYDIDVSNNASLWTTIKAVTGNSTSGIHTYFNLNAAGQYVRMYGMTRDTIYGYSLYDFEVLGLSGTNTGKAPTVNSTQSITVAAGSSLSYQITATNSPTSYGETNLPAGLSFNSSTGVISGTITQTGTYNLTVSAINSYGTGNAPLAISVLTPFADWQTIWFTPAQLQDPTISGPTATPAGDGITNLMKYALNLDPLTNGTAGLPVASAVVISGQSYLTLAYTKVLAATDITYTVEVSGDLQTWSSGSSYTTTVSITNNPDGKTATVVERDLIPENSATQRFIRLKVSMP